MIYKTKMTTITKSKNVCRLTDKKEKGGKTSRQLATASVCPYFFILTAGGWRDGKIGDIEYSFFGVIIINRPVFLTI